MTVRFYLLPVLIWTPTFQLFMLRSESCYLVYFYVFLFITIPDYSTARMGAKEKWL